ncbi:hypothetical protein LEM8419_01705 [Neolewinella maritima]|uniref:Copper-binding protein MbnP-like domain-containing protein n=1 Tax=Neolewinella maritima TaxID=1383882 RepID=A0ABM9B0E6_9BACT|nr:MbnP family protein [Neolewinella maritima]CAH1000571.1 hypothetical protein LEM8419_01705 [Neolewinella maritima]
MKHLLLYLLLLLGLTACLDDDDLPAVAETDLTLDFRAEYGGEGLAIQREAYGYPTGDTLKLLLFQYYVSDLELLPAGGAAPVRLAEIDLLRWNSASDSATLTRSYRVPAGEYVGLRFGLGVKPELNAQDPSTFAADYVLNEAEFWGPTTRYVFAKIEANADLEGDGRFDTGLSYHMGSDALYTTVEFARDLRIGPGQTEQLTVVADVLRALSGNGETFAIDNPDQQAVHGGNQAVAQDIWNRLAAQFTLEVR